MHNALLKAHGGMSAKTRNSLPASEFGLPAQRKYPMPDLAHARNAKARASEMYHKGRLSKTQFERINTMADRMLSHGM